MLLIMVGNKASCLYGVPRAHVVISDLSTGLGGPADPIGVRWTTMGLADPPRGPAEPMGLWKLCGITC